MAKAHIYFNYGYWRVSPMPGNWHSIEGCYECWRLAHAFVIRLNENIKPNQIYRQINVRREK